MDENERKTVITSDQFMDFFEKSTKLIERALNEKYDYLMDYADNDLSK